MVVDMAERAGDCLPMLELFGDMVEMCVVV